ncbi:hypothetical protein GYMLUDRAFT_83158 [Collybiopsis luxurians FD-317 M1]|nr:hypothetical protein GYMLUDRAFT_83158 [Collybiopsis luxurians FD-317 M1]
MYRRPSLPERPLLHPTMSLHYLHSSPLTRPPSQLRWPITAQLSKTLTKIYLTGPRNISAVVLRKRSGSTDGKLSGHTVLTHDASSCAALPNQSSWAYGYSRDNDGFHRCLVSLSSSSLSYTRSEILYSSFEFRSQSRLIPVRRGEQPYIDSIIAHVEAFETTSELTPLSSFPPMRGTEAGPVLWNVSALSDKRMLGSLPPAYGEQKYLGLLHVRTSDFFAGEVEIVDILNYFTFTFRQNHEELGQVRVVVAEGGGHGNRAVTVNF